MNFNLKEFRESRNLSTYKVAKLMNMSQSSYFRFENNTSKVDLKRLQLFADVFGVSVFDVLKFSFRGENFDLERILMVLGFSIRIDDGVTQAYGVSLPNYGSLSIYLHRKLHEYDNKMCVLCFDPNSSMDELYIGKEPDDYFEFSMLFEMLFPGTELSVKAKQLCNASVTNDLPLV